MKASRIVIPLLVLLSLQLRAQLHFNASEFSSLLTNESMPAKLAFQYSMDSSYSLLKVHSAFDFHNALDVYEQVKHGHILLQNITSIGEFRAILSSLGQTSVFINDREVAVASLKGQAEIDTEIAQSPYLGKKYHFTSDCNDSTKQAYYEFQIFHLHSKLLTMKQEDYYAYLLSGQVSQLESKIADMQDRKEEFISSLSD